MSDLHLKKPQHIQLMREEKILKIKFNDGTQFNYEAEYLRTQSPCNQHATSHSGVTQFQIIPGCKNVNIQSIEPIGDDGIRIIFEDHTDIYSWQYLYELGDQKHELWDKYLSLLSHLGLTRD